MYLLRSKSILEFVDGIGNLLGNGQAGGILLAATVVPVVALAVYCVFSRSITHSQDQKGRVLQISLSVEKVRVKSKSEEKNPESKIKVTNEKVSHQNRCDDDWRNDPTNPFSPLFDNRSNNKTSSSNNCKEVNNNNDWRKDATNPFNENCTTISSSLTIEWLFRKLEGKALC